MESGLPVGAETVQKSQSTTIAGRPATDVLTALGSDDLEEARQALSDIYQAYFETLWHFAYRWTRSRDHAQEFVQNVFLRLWTRRATLILRGEIVVYLRNAVRKEIYHEARHTGVVARMEAAIEGQIVEVPAIGRSVDPASAVEEAELDSMITKALATISARDRDVMTMRLIDWMTLDEIASELSISKSRVRTILYRATARVAHVLKSFREG